MIVDNGAGDISFSFYRCSGAPAGTPCEPVTSASTAGLTGWTYLALPAIVTIDNFNYTYGLEASMPADVALTLLRRAIVYYSLQVSPAPGTATLNDLPVSDPAYQFIEAFQQAGITAGCSAAPPLYSSTGS